MVVLAGLIPVYHDAPTLAAGQRRRAAVLVVASAVLVVASAVCGAGTLWALVRRRMLPARAGAVGAVVSVLLGWAVAQYPWLLVDQVTIQDAAGARATLVGLLVVVGLAGVLVVPPLMYLFHLTQQPERHEPVA